VCALARNVIRGTARGNFGLSSLTVDETVDLALKEEKLFKKVIDECMGGKVEYYSCGWAGAFAKAAIVFGEPSVIPLLRLYVSITNGDETRPKGDPIRTLHELIKYEKKRQTGSGEHFRDWIQYPYTVMAIRAALDKESLDLKALRARTLVTRHVTVPPRQKNDLPRQKVEIEILAKDFAKGETTSKHKKK